ncbi:MULTISPECIES: plasmid pRiA4b ORF-3 family protein [unclassified Rhodococcus (in: high G+C Gram-positive bacteria)]|uniref:plasmid pRiA4b ORF-3 family protein n=1 Tax=unclassified Rhodococcus (in: high G+C Gram-positive bacteria) TaxID=192944 RepID=UPI0016399138|nr:MULTISPECIES: plasmid pRiA4b ORF-3 family protein [unclassified Rhodococcus (in: high G+C Gram-positive bacteria)]MBC2639107.1 plasmid pRiA4b ORF-3 family protein [Rhodococcus sp. 3A]MBC2896151.1 plasmid pRiA4b ORF-3 family protein [Rhodococcus sp. 4CII]
MGSNRRSNPGQKRAAKQKARQRRNRSTVSPLFPTPAVDQALIDSFVQWLHGGDLTEDAEAYGHLVESTLTNLAHARPGFRATGWLPADAHTLLEAADELVAQDSDNMDDVAMTIVASTLTFLNFLDENRLWTGTEEDFTHCIEDLLEFVEPEPPVLFPDDIPLPTVDEEDELRALLALPAITALAALVDWVGTSKPVTSTKVPKPVSVPALADALGIDLDVGSVGIPRVGKIRSMREVPDMMSYWETAEEVGLITVNSTRAARGPNAELFADRTTGALPLIRAAVTEFVRSQLVSTHDHPDDLTQLTDVVVMQVILAGMTPEPSLAPSEDAPLDDEQSIMDEFIHDRLETLVEQKWLTKDDAYRVPAALQPAVLRAVQLASPETEYALPDVVDSQVTLRISLEGTHIPIWRRIRLDATLPLAALHDIIQSAFGWEDSHLHEFSVGPAYSGGGVFIPADDIAHRDVEGPAVPEEEVPIGLLLSSVGDHLTYLYDFGDDWIHHIVVESVDDPHPDFAGALCLDGGNMAPYEDSGGPWGWAAKIDASADPRHEEHAEIREWLGLRPGQQLDPTSFDRDRVNEDLATLFG